MSLPDIPPPPVPTQLIVFADDWGRHPSSSQHLIRELLPQYPTLWVNTTGTRRPKLNRADFVRGLQKVWNTLSASDAHIDHMDPLLPENLYVIEPFMYPGFRTGWQRKYNRRKLTKAIHGYFGQTLTTMPLFARTPPGKCRRVVITTLPITADLVGKLDVDRWVYYCVDDYAAWPGTDSAVMQAMERELVGKVDGAVCVSEVLRDRVVGVLGDQRQDAKAPRRQEEVGVLSHGVDVDFWQTTQPPDADVFGDQAIGFMDLNGSPLTFWGLVDGRLDKTWVSKLSQACNESTNQSLKVCLVGPVVGSSQEWVSLTCAHRPMRGGEVVCCDRVDHDMLPAIAYFSKVLIMPYIDAPVTRAMQPLKLLEYLATMKPVVVRDLPSTRAWADCCDLASDAESFVRLVQQRAQTGTPPEQREARKRRLARASWTAKAAQLAELISAGATA